MANKNTHKMMVYRKKKICERVHEATNQQLQKSERSRRLWEIKRRSHLSKLLLYKNKEGKNRCKKKKKQSCSVYFNP